MNLQSCRTDRCTLFECQCQWFGRGHPSHAKVKALAGKRQYLHFSVIFRPWVLPGSTPGNSWWGCAARFSESRPYFRPKNAFPPFFDLEVVTKRNIHVYIDIIITAIRTPTQKLSLIHKTTNASIHYSGGPDYRSSLVNHTRFQTKMYKIYTLCGGTYLCGLYKGVPPGEYWSGPGRHSHHQQMVVK